MAAQKWTKGLGGASAAVVAVVLVSVGAQGGPAIGGGSSTKPAATKPAARPPDQGGLTRVKEVSRRATNCAANAHGAVKQFFTTKPCVSLRRAVFLLGDGKGNTVAVSVAWVDTASAGDASELRKLADANGTGNVTPLPAALVGAGSVRFTGANYESRTAGKLVVIAQAEGLKGRRDRAFLKGAAETAARFPPP
nr:hypothetical protein [Kibdelosporangium sp. MJ126-NF4]CEL21154.1 hypothetical protein [Kibdelosporangium sp. MJ126-NF4]CTQ96280.1 hypothetical protein [Kibdelosporangium sp. MJ126-NF4]